MQVEFHVNHEWANSEGCEVFEPRVSYNGENEDIGIDFFSPRDFVLPSGSCEVVNTFVAIALPKGYGMILKPRGGDEHLVGSGVIDTGFRGEIRFRVINPYSYSLIFREGESLGQGVLIRVSDSGIQLKERFDTIEFKTETRRRTAGRITN